MSDPRPPSRNEGIKAESRFLRGTIGPSLQDVITGAIPEDDTQLTKFHGIYQQDDRDLRPERAKTRMEKAFSFMARLRIPGGNVTPRQWLAMDRLAQERANGTIRITTRETIQFHGIIKSNLRPAIQAINAALLDTVAACGDVNRNVICTPALGQPAVHAEIIARARALSAHLRPRSGAYHEIWLDGEPVTAATPEVEPLYGPTYLPRKFKIAIAVPPSNDVDVFAHDLGFVAIEEAGRIAGYTVTVGGGMGMTHGELDTFPRTADVFGFCTADQVLAVAEAIVIVQRDHGDRAVRKHARLKYTIEQFGLEWFRAAVEAELGWRLAAPRPFHFERTGDRLGWAEDPDGVSSFTLFIASGRVQGALLAGLRAIAEVHTGEFILTANQNLTIAGITAAARPTIAALLAAHDLTNPEGGLRRNAMACVALPTCGLALAESERYLPDLLAALEPVLVGLGLAEDEVVIRMTGCPNGCARPYLAEIGLVGRGPGTYNLYLGGAFDGTRLNKLYARDVNEAGIVAALTPLFAGYAAGRQPAEHFSDWAIRAGKIAPTLIANQFHADLAPELAP